MRNKIEEGAVVIAHKVDSTGTKRLREGHDSEDGDFRRVNNRRLRMMSWNERQHLPNYRTDPRYVVVLFNTYDDQDYPVYIAVPMMYAIGNQSLYRGMCLSQLFVMCLVTSERKSSAPEGCGIH